MVVPDVAHAFHDVFIAVGLARESGTGRARVYLNTDHQEAPMEMADASLRGWDDPSSSPTVRGSSPDNQSAGEGAGRSSVRRATQSDRRRDVEYGIMAVHGSEGGAVCEGGCGGCGR